MSILTGALEQGWQGLSIIFQNIYAALPQVIIAIVFLLVGFGIGKISKKVIVRVLDKIGFKKVTSKSGTDKALYRTGYRYDTSSLIGDLIKWVFYLIFAGAAVQVLFGEQILSEILISTATYIPRIIAVIIVVMAGFVFGDLASKVVIRFLETVEIERGGKKSIASISSLVVRILILLFAIVISLNILGIYSEIFTITFGLIAIAVILFILLGAKDLVPNIMAGMYLQSSGKIRKGYKIKAAGVEGKVKEVGLIFTILDTRKGEFQIPNSVLLKEKSFVQ